MPVGEADMVLGELLGGPDKTMVGTTDMVGEGVGDGDGALDGDEVGDLVGGLVGTTQVSNVLGRRRSSVSII